jgi:CheY-like chemotaxis protein
MNLVTNASEALAENRGVISITASPACLPDGDYVRLEVADNGCGMTEDVSARMFDPYFTTKFAGRGLGLAAVQGIVRAHGGVISVATAAGQGTRCEVLLPCSRDPVPGERRPVQRAPEAERIDRHGTVLIVEDEGSLRTPVSKMLRRRGFSVIEAGDGMSAVELFREHAQETDAVLLDMTLPGLSGPEVFRELRRIKPDVRVILTTAYSHETVLAAVGKDDAWGFIRKPYELKALVASLRDACVARR